MAATIEKGKLISKLGYISYFNEMVMGRILSTAGNVLYHGGDKDVSLMKDCIPHATVDAEGNAKLGTTEVFGVARNPVYPLTAYAGANTTEGYAYISNPKAIPDGQMKVLQDVGNNLTLTEEAMDKRAEELGQDPTLIVADVLYSCCFSVIRALISIRPFTATWKHESSVAGKRINARVGTGYNYGFFVDNPTWDGSWGKTQGSGTWGQGGALHRWQVTQGGNINTLRLTEESVARNGIYKGSVAAAGTTANMVANFWDAWASRCKEKNTFSYNLYSCHLNCHSSCHNSCHGSRSRR